MSEQGLDYCRNCGDFRNDLEEIETEEFGNLPFCNKNCYKEWQEEDNL